MESEYIKHSVGPILTEALQSLLLHVPYPGTQQSSFATSIDPIEYLGQYLLRHAQQEEENIAADALRAADKAIIDNFADQQTRLEASKAKLGDDLVVRLSEVLRKSQVAEEAAATVNIAEKLPEPIPEEVLMTTDSIYSPEVADVANPSTQVVSEASPVADA